MKDVIRLGQGSAETRSSNANTNNAVDGAFVVAGPANKLNKPCYVGPVEFGIACAFPLQ
jgi:hypothetical protein